MPEERVMSFAEGPLFIFSLTFMLLGLTRLVISTLIDLRRMKARTPDKSANTCKSILRTFKWLNPVRYVIRNDRPLYTVFSLVFHTGLLAVPAFFSSHTDLWRKTLGPDLPSMSNGAADVITIASIVSGGCLVALRLLHAGSRRLSSLQDWLLTPLCITVLATGYMAAHAGGKPFDYNFVRLIHVLSADLLMVLIPITKLSHCVLVFFTQHVVDFGWRFVPGTGRAVREALRTTWGSRG